ncbi:MAG TPA: TIGR03620 family F420-dependent LLM class oxidoreductase [Thermoleophilaceae bacterium]|nr:TIGR03620 family F420-dependent LLM class oxidoreductase [Thermoleophilaceae bacterium]
MSATVTERLGRVGVWMSIPASAALDEVRGAVGAVEDLGFSAFWYGESPTTREALVQAALLLEATERITFATGITSIYSRDATALDAGALALEEAFPDRLVVGLGVSHAPAVARRGHDYGKPVAMMRAYLDALDEREREHEALSPPRVLAALRPRMLELARERAAGAHPYLVPVEHTRRARETLGADRVLAPEVTVLIDRNAARAREQARVFLARYLAMPNYRNNLLALGYADGELDPNAPSDRVVADLVALGDADAAAERVRAHREAGADHVCVQALGDLRAAVGQLRTLAPLVVLAA